tara:strand:- start:497 stop:1063 length:567 start_codon:yes stop_codon:yes gene_type:complete
MNNYSKILIAVIISSLFVISSCKKEEVIEGCTDSSAMNYLSNATSNDGSCIFAYVIAQGIWNISSECDDLDVFGFTIPLNTLLPPTIEITAEGDGVVSLDINGSSVLADVANNGVVDIQDNQTISFDTSILNNPALQLLLAGLSIDDVIDIEISGSGTIISDSNGDLLLNLSNSLLSIDTDCEITFTR